MRWQRDFTVRIISRWECNPQETTYEQISSQTHILLECNDLSAPGCMILSATFRKKNKPILFKPQMPSFSRYESTWLLPQKNLVSSWIWLNLTYWLVVPVWIMGCWMISQLASQIFAFYWSPHISWVVLARAFVLFSGRSSWNLRTREVTGS